MFLSEKLELILSLVAEDPTEENMKEAIIEISNIIIDELSKLVEDLKASNHTDATGVPIIRANVKRLNNTVNSVSTKILVMGDRLLKKDAVLLLCELQEYPKEIYENI